MTVAILTVQKMHRVVMSLIHNMNNIGSFGGGGIFWLQRIINTRIHFKMVEEQPSLENLIKRVDFTLPVVFEI